MHTKHRTVAGLLVVVALTVGSAWLLRRAPDPECRAFDPDRVASLEKAGWEAYYARNWPAVFALMVQMNRTQFCMSRLDAVLAAVDIVRAAAAFAPVDNDTAAAMHHLQNFYARAGASAGLRTDAATLARLEMDYWRVHRELAVARKAAPDHTGDITPMVDALEKLHAVLFDAPPAAVRRSADARARAAVTVDRITGGYSQDIDADWLRIEQDLKEAYQAVAAEPNTVH